MNSAKEAETARVLHGDVGVWPLPSLFRNLLCPYHTSCAGHFAAAGKTAALLAMPWLAIRFSAALLETQPVAGILLDLFGLVVV